jgi:N-acetylornithine carbamoyltransferase
MNFINEDDWEDSKILSLLKTAEYLKKEKITTDLLHQKILAMIFFNPSTRTRASFEIAMFRDGGKAICIEPGKGSWGIETRRGVVMDEEYAEHLIEATRVLSRYADVIGVRAFPIVNSTWEEAKKDSIIWDIAWNSNVPVISMESARRHPCQGLADTLTLQEKLGPNTNKKKFLLTWAYHPKSLPTAVPVSAALSAGLLGMDITIAHPPGFELDEDDMKTIYSRALRNGGTVKISNDLDAAIKDQHVVYAKSWGSLKLRGLDLHSELKLRRKYKNWIINEARMGTTLGNKGIFMHCLPVRRNVIVTDGVLDSFRSVVTDQAENRIHTQRALLIELLS